MNVDNLQVYNRPDVTAHYAALDYLTPCEELLFDRYIKPGAAVLDLGVGGGRTTPYLSRRASRYVGVDYASEMIDTCRRKYPGLEFLEAEASDLSALERCSFDVVVCAFNGLDYVMDEARGRCFKECRRVLKPDGVLVFSSHNARSIFVRPVWNRERVRTAAEAVGSADRFTGKAAFFALNLAAGARAFLRAVWSSARRILARVPSRSFWRGEGYLLDPAHGGLMTHCWVPGRVAAAVQEERFLLLRVLGNDYPRASHEYVTDWYYYVFSRSNPAADGEPCA
jgi:ubiquinone/menaquinone biosynthesis C-methylase UbiE